MKLEFWVSDSKEKKVIEKSPRFYLFILWWDCFLFKFSPFRAVDLNFCHVHQDIIVTEMYWIWYCCSSVEISIWIEGRRSWGSKSSIPTHETQCAMLAVQLFLIIFPRTMTFFPYVQRKQTILLMVMTFSRAWFLLTPRSIRYAKLWLGINMYEYPWSSSMTLQCNWIQMSSVEQD